MTNELVLSMFPGLDLLGKAFEGAGFCVVRGPDLLWGGAVADFHPPAGVFAGVIGGPPCQKFSTASEIVGSSAVDLIPEFLRVVRAAQPAFVVMENVRGAEQHDEIPSDWWPARLRDWDCGGETSRSRSFWTWPFALLQPPRRKGAPSPSVLASTAKKGSLLTSTYAEDKSFLPGDLPLEEYERLQGVPGITAELRRLGASRYLTTHLLGNGVPLPMGRYVAENVRRALESS